MSSTIYGRRWAVFAVKMEFAAVILSCLFASIYASEKVFVPLAPPSVTFTSKDAIKSSQLGDIVSSILGYTVQSEDPWNSLAPVMPFKAAKVTVVLDFDGFDGDTTLDVSGTSFPLQNTGNLRRQMELVAERTLERFSDQEPLVLYMKTGEKLYGAKMAYPELLLPVSPEVDSRLRTAVKDADLVRLLKDGTFNASLPGDDQFLVELHTARIVLEQMSKKATKGGPPSVVWLRMSGLRHILDRYSEESYQASHALRLIREFVNKAKTMLQKSYGDKALLVVIAQNDKSSGLIRRSRSLLAAESIDLQEGALGAPPLGAAPQLTAQDQWNLAEPWSEDFHVAFAIIAFLLILFTLSIFGISVGIWFMDPGRDSIIYRMTSQRMKKD